MQKRENLKGLRIRCFRGLARHGKIKFNLHFITGRKSALISERKVGEKISRQIDKANSNISKS
jgi:hypothetical protein